MGLVALLVLVGCTPDNPAAPLEKVYASIIGQILDKASGNGIPSAYVKITQEGNTYGTTTNSSGHFNFADINSGTYKLISEVTNNGTVIIDTVGFFSTDSTDWGLILSEIFVSISGTITLEGELDNSFIDVLLLGTGSSAVTDNGGHFRFDFILPGQYDLYASFSDDYLEYRVNDLLLNAGESFVVDTTLSYRFRPLELLTLEPLFPSARNRGYGGYAYYDGNFYYGNQLGLRKYSVQDETDSLIYSRQFLGQLMITSDYTDGVWFNMDQPDNLQCRRYSISTNTITDSIPSQTFLTFQFSTAWDPLTQKLFGIQWGGGTKIKIYDPETGVVETKEFPFQYDASKYDHLSLLNIFIDPYAKLYLVVGYHTVDASETHLYVCTNTIDFEVENIYRIDTDYNAWSKLWWYEDRLLSEAYLWDQNILYEFILE